MADTEDDIIDVLGGNAQSQLRSFVERTERLIEDRKAVQDDIKEIMAEAKGSGFDTKIIRQAIKVRAMDKAKRQEAEALLELYLSALGDL